VDELWDNMDLVGDLQSDSTVLDGNQPAVPSDAHVVGATKLPPSCALGEKESPSSLHGKKQEFKEANREGKEEEVAEEEGVVEGKGEEAGEVAEGEVADEEAGETREAGEGACSVEGEVGSKVIPFLNWEEEEEDWDEQVEEQAQNGGHTHAPPDAGATLLAVARADGSHEEEEEEEGSKKESVARAALLNARVRFAPAPSSVAYADTVRLLHTPRKVAAPPITTHTRALLSIRALLAP
jgi:hypothetical protein